MSIKLIIRVFRYFYNMLILLGIMRFISLRLLHKSGLAFPGGRLGSADGPASPSQVRDALRELMKDAEARGGGVDA
jgi:hypothetical protein